VPQVQEESIYTRPAPVRSSCGVIIRNHIAIIHETNHKYMWFVSCIINNHMYYHKYMWFVSCIITNRSICDLFRVLSQIHVICLVYYHKYIWFVSCIITNPNYLAVCCNQSRIGRSSHSGGRIGRSSHSGGRIGRSSHSGGRWIKRM